MFQYPPPPLLPTSKLERTLELREMKLSTKLGRAALDSGVEKIDTFVL